MTTGHERCSELGQPLRHDLVEVQRSLGLGDPPQELPLHPLHQLLHLETFGLQHHVPLLQSVGLGLQVALGKGENIFYREIS